MGGNYPPLNRRQAEKILKALGFTPKPGRHFKFWDRFGTSDEMA
jgi:hypothetical protein